MEPRDPLQFSDQDNDQRAIFRELHTAVVALRDSARSDGDSVDAVTLWKEALLAAQALERHAQAAGGAVCLDQLAHALEELESAARSFFRDTTAGDEESARRCAVLRAVSRLLLRLTRELEERQPRDETPFLIQELVDVNKALDGEEEQSDEDDVGERDILRDTRVRIQDVHVQVLEAQGKRQIAAAEAVKDCSGISAYRTFRLSRALAETSFVLVSGAQFGNDAVPESLRLLSDKLMAESVRLRDLFLGFMQEAQSREDLEICLDAVSWIRGELDRARVDSYDDRRPIRIEKLKRLEEDGQHYARSVRDVEKAVAVTAANGGVRELLPPLRHSRRRIDRMLRRTGNVIADRILAFRLDRAFGAARVLLWEKMIFWLIMGVMILIVIDHFSGAPDPDVRTPIVETGSTADESWEEVADEVIEQISWTIWVDTIICLILLWDFMVRLTLSPARLKYFRRNFLTEFLPSLPFGLLHGIMTVDKLRFVRTARLVRVARVLRVLRPIIRILRLFLFLARAADRLVERNSWFLNQNIVFATEEETQESQLTLLSRARNIDSWIAAKTSSMLADLPFAARLVGADWRMGLVEAEFTFLDGGVAAAEAGRPQGGEQVRDLNVDSVIETLRGLDDNQVAEIVGVDVARQLTDSLSFFRLPFLRRFAFARFILGPSGAPDPLWTTARLGRLSGDLLALVARAVHWFGDLYGTITGAQFLDRVGMQLVKATSRPAKRLVILTAAIGIILGVAWLTQIPAVINGVQGVTSMLGPVVLLLGLVCFIPLALGVWLRRIAGQAVDFYDRVSEAQFFALTETAKERRSNVDIAYLVDRVLMPEHRLMTVGQNDAEEEAARAAIISVCAKDGTADDEASPLPWSVCDAMMLYYRDFLDGSYFHKNDTKIANILIGNLTLENVRRNRLHFGKKGFKRLDKLDIARDKGGVSGPRVWFNFITHSVAQHTARLIIEYNQHCIPVDEYEAADAADRQIFDEWLARRQRISEARRRNELLTAEEMPPVSEKEGTLLYRTTEFNALNFLTRETERDKAVRMRFGDVVADLLEEDRMNLIRDIFGTFPMHELPKEKRTINPYRLYRRYLARGRLFLSPLIVVWLALKGVRLLFKRIISIVKDVLNPNDRPIKLSAGRSGFDVARRKIHRMRRPVVMEAVHMRALFDLEYVGVAAPGIPEDTIRSEDLLVEDLRWLEASERDWESFRELKTEREHQARVLSRFLRRREEAGESLVAEVVKRNPKLAGREAEIMRVVATAFVCNHQGVLAVLDAVKELRDLVERLPRVQSTWARLSGSRKTLARVERYWSLFAPADVSSELKRTLATTLDRGHRAQRVHLDNLEKHLPKNLDPETYVYETLVAAGEKPSSWNEQILAVRCVQSLGMLDLAGYEAIIRELGAYPEAVRSDSAASKSHRL